MRTLDLARWCLSGLALALAGCDESFSATAGYGGGGTSGTTTTTTMSTTSAGGGGGQTTTETGGGGSAGCAPVQNDGCNNCLASQCTDTYCACTGSPDCLGLIGCIAQGGANPQLSWYELCWHDHQPSISLAGNLSVCGSKACPECGIPPVDPCLACEYANCPDQVNNCLSTSACTGYIACRRDCDVNGNPVGCKDMCDTKFPDGIAPWQWLVGCTANACQADCGT